MVVFDDYSVKIGTLYYYAIHNTIENKIIGFRYYRSKPSPTAMVLHYSLILS